MCVCKILRFQIPNWFFIFFSCTFLIVIESTNEQPCSLSLARNVNVSFCKGYLCFDIYSMCPNVDDMPLWKSQLKGERQVQKILYLQFFSGYHCLWYKTKLTISGL